MQRIIWTLVIAALVPGGCEKGTEDTGVKAAPDGDAAQSTIHDETGAAGFELQPVIVITDQETIAAARADWQQRNTQEVRRIVDLIRAGYEPADDDQYALERHREESVRQLQAIIQGGREPLIHGQANPVSFESVIAADALRRLDDPRGNEHLLQALKSSDELTRSMALNALMLPWDAPYPFAQPHEQALVLTLMDDDNEQTRKLAFEICSKVLPPGFEQKVRAAVERGDLEPGEGLKAIAPITTDPAVVDAVLESINPESGIPWGTSAILHHLLNNPAPAVSSRAREALVLIIERHGLLLYTDWLMVRSAGRHGGEVGARWLEEILSGPPDAFTGNNPLTTAVFEGVGGVDLGAHTRAMALEALLEAQPQRRMELARKHFKAAPGAASLALVEASDPAEQSAILELLATMPAEDLPNVTVQAIINRFGDAGRAFVVRHIEPLAARRGDLQWRLDGLTTLEALAELRSAGVVEVAPPVAIEQWRRRMNYERLGVTIHFLDAPFYLMDVLIETGAVIEGDDDESSDWGLSPRHDRLVLDLARLSRGVFQPRFMMTEWTPSSRPPQFMQPVQFEFDNRLYRIAARDGVGPDVEAVITAANRALRDSRRPERFISWPYADHPIVAFGDPQHVLPLLRKYRLCDIENMDNPVIFEAPHEEPLE